MRYCGCDIQLQSVITVCDEGEFPREPDEHALAWEALYVPSVSDERDPNKAPIEIRELNSIPETPHGQHDQGDVSPEDPAKGVAVRVDTKERMTQTPPLLSRLNQGPEKRALLFLRRGLVAQEGVSNGCAFVTIHICQMVVLLIMIAIHALVVSCVLSHMAVACAGVVRVWVLCVCGAAHVHRGLCMWAELHSVL